MRSLLIAIALVCLTACGAVGFPGVYRIDIEQGNLVTQEMVDQLKPGMSRRQVRFIMGTPLVEDSFNQSRWDYPYVIRNGRNVIREANLTIYFDGDTMTHLAGDYAPRVEGEAEPEEAIARPLAQVAEDQAEGQADDETQVEEEAQVEAESQADEDSEQSEDDEDDA